MNEAGTMASDEDDAFLLDDLDEVTPQVIAEDDRRMLERQRHFRLAADAVTAAFMAFPEVAAVALFGSAAVPLRREVPRFRPYRRRRISLWHECMDVDLALWLDRLDGLQALNRARNRAVQRLHDETGVGVAQHQVDVFVLRAGTNDYLGRLCLFGQCPKGKIECVVPGCGRPQFLRRHSGFRLRRDALAEGKVMRIYERGAGLLRRAADTPPSGVA